MGAVHQIRHRQTPDHDYAWDHILRQARLKLRGRKEDRLAAIADLDACGVVACDRIREFAFDIGFDWGGPEFEEKRGWIAHAAKEMGVPYGTLWQIVRRDQKTVDQKTVTNVFKTTGISVSFFYDPEIGTR